MNEPQRIETQCHCGSNAIALALPDASGDMVVWCECGHVSAVHYDVTTLLFDFTSTSIRTWRKDKHQLNVKTL